jgi:hypothetical protein
MEVVRSSETSVYSIILHGVTSKHPEDDTLQTHQCHGMLSYILFSHVQWVSSYSMKPYEPQTSVNWKRNVGMSWTGIWVVHETIKNLVEKIIPDLNLSQNLSAQI